MKIALDAMGGDRAPKATVHGAVWAARDFGLTIQLVSRPEIIEAELAKHNIRNLNLPIIPASEVIEMDEYPATAVKSKKDSSMVVAIHSVEAGESDAFITAGNSGGALAAALFGLGRIKGVKRPALSAPSFPPSPNAATAFCWTSGPIPMSAPNICFSLPRWAITTPSAFCTFPIPGWGCHQPAKKKTREIS